MNIPGKLSSPESSKNKYLSTSEALLKWMIGSCVLAGSAALSFADVVQITHSDLITTTNTGAERNTIDGDFTADGVIDVTNVVGNFFPAQEYVNLLINSVVVASAGSTTNEIYATVNGARTAAPTGSTAQWYVTQSGLIPITFRDGRINGGALTSALIEVRSVAAVNAAKIQVLRTVFDDESTAPPAGVVAGRVKPMFVAGRAAAEAAQRIAYSNEIKKLKKKIKKLKKSGKKKEAKKLEKKLNITRQKLNRLLAG